MIADTPHQRLLLVDDDSRVLQGMWRVIRRSKCSWHIDLASSGDEALQLMQKGSYDVIITDMQMPGVGGAELLATVSHLHPRTIRFSLSGYTDKAMIMQAAGLSHQFFAKPCRFEKLRDAVDGVLHFRAMLADDSTETMVATIESLPLLPYTYDEVSNILGDRDATVSRLASLVKEDIGLAAKVLHLANWSIFSPRKPVRDVHQALSCIGIDVLRNLFLTTCLFRPFDDETLDAFDIPSLYQRSRVVSELAGAIAQCLDPDEAVAREASLAGLLHDVGTLVYIASRPLEYQAAYQEHLQGGKSMTCLESKLFGSTHAETGGALLTLWGLPPHVAEGIAFHHQDTCTAPSHPVATALRIATALAEDIAEAHATDLSQYVAQTCRRRLDLPPYMPIWPGMIKQAAKEETPS